tara:strand:- start:482 stop:643 length:162 start_codon:yes stop_codon:yes gene_type:complete
MIQKLFIIIGILFILIGLLYPFLKDLGLGRLPGDIVIKKKTPLFIFQLLPVLL